MYRDSTNFAIEIHSKINCSTSQNEISTNTQRQLCTNNSIIFSHSTPLQSEEPALTRVYGGLKDQDRIFTNVYGEQSWRIDDAMKRVN